MDLFTEMIVFIYEMGFVLEQMFWIFFIGIVAVIVIGVVLVGAVSPILMAIHNKPFNGFAYKRNKRGERK